MNRPQALNAIDPEIRARLPQTLAEAEADEAVRVLVLQGAGERAFCAGADVKAFGPAGSLVGLRQARAHQHWMGQFERVRKPVIAAVHGCCIPREAQAAIQRKIGALRAAVTGKGSRNKCQVWTKNRLAAKMYPDHPPPL